MAVSTADLRIADRCIADYSNEQRGPLLYHNRDDHDSTVTRRNNHDHTWKEKKPFKMFWRINRQLHRREGFMSVTHAAAAAGHGVFLEK